MATFVPYHVNIKFNQSFTEPCMSCFASVTYNRDEVRDNPQVTGGKCITSPSCGKLMAVNFINVQSY